MTDFADGARLTHGADEFIFVELSDEMSLESTLRVIAITNELRSEAIPGIIDICPAHVSYMLRVIPDLIDPRDLVDTLRAIHARCAGQAQLTIRARLIEIPILYADPWTTETLMRFRERHQAPELTDLEYCAQVNGFSDAQGFIDAHSANPFIATFIGFMPGNAESYQLVPRDRQLEVAKYLRPRTDTPDRALGHGGAFTTIYPVRGVGGFQLLGRSAVPVFDPDRRLPDFEGSLVLPRGGDIFKYRPIAHDEYDDIRAEVEAGSYRYRMREVNFSLSDFMADPTAYNENLLEGLQDA